MRCLLRKWLNLRRSRSSDCLRHVIEVLTSAHMNDLLTTCRIVDFLAHRRCICNCRAHTKRCLTIPGALRRSCCKSTCFRLTELIGRLWLAIRIELKTTVASWRLKLRVRLLAIIHSLRLYDSVFIRTLLHFSGYLPSEVKLVS